MNGIHRTRARGLGLAALLGGALAAPPALATQGTFPHGYGVKAEGMGGVGIAYSQDGLAGATNPAGMVGVGNRLDLGIAFLQVDNGAKFGGVDYSGSDDKSLYIIPQLGANYMLDTDSSIGLSIVGNGVGTNYDNSDNLGGLEAPSSELKQVVSTLSYARRVMPGQSVGVGLVVARQVLDIGGTASIGLPEGRAESYGAGLRLGWQGEVAEGLTLGATYATKVNMSRMNVFRNLLPEHGDLDIPANYGVGLAYTRGPLTVGVDAMRILWSDVAGYGNDGVGSASGAPGSSNGPGFGWNDQTVWRFGVAYAVDAQLTLRAGYNFGTRLINSRSTYLGILAPAADRRHATVGATWTFASGNELSFAYSRSPKETTSGNGNGPDALTDLYMGQNWLSASYSLRF